MADDATTIEGLQAEITRLRAKNRDLSARVAELDGELGETRKAAEGGAAAAKALAELQAKHAADSAGWEEERAIYQGGLTDPEAIGVAKFLHGQIPEKDRGKLGDAIKAWTADPAKAPRALQGYLTPPKADGKAAPAAGAKAPPGEGGAKGAVPGDAQRAAGGTKWTPADVRGLMQEAQRTGDWTRYKAVQAEIANQVAAETGANGVGVGTGGGGGIA